jgi:superfamily II DNA or RNA helicase
MSKQLRQYQIEARDAVVNSDIGQIILPTGTGKSTIQAAVIESLIQSNSGFGIYVILTPRILLTNQLMSTVASDLTASGITTLKALTVHSGVSVSFYEEDEVNDEEKSVFDFLDNKSTTDSKTVELEILMAKAHNRPMLICCTYDSIPAMLRGIMGAKAQVTQTLCDEAHYITEKTNNENIVALKNISNRIHYFTATQKITTSKVGLGMNNTEVFGDVIYRKTPREMIEAGFMVQPRIHSVLAGKETSISKITMDAFIEHSKYVYGDAKMLVCCNGTKTVEEIRNNADFKAWAKSEGITIFSVTSKYGAWIDETDYKRDEFLTVLKNHSTKAIVLHVAILTEGIDVPDMTGVVFVRNMALCRFLQSLGRTTRKLAVDFGKSFEDCVKKFAYAVVIDRVDDGESQDQYSNLTKMVRDMREAGFEAKETIYTESDIGTDADVDLEDTNQRDRRVKALKTAMDEVDHEIEAEEIASIVSASELSEQQQVEMLFNI